MVAPVERRSIPYEIDATGTVEPVQSAAVTPQVGGLVRRIAFREGGEVRAGQVLVEIDPQPFQAAVARAAAVLARDRAQAESARLELARATALAGRDLIAQGELDRRRAEAETQAATVRADSAALESARLDLRHATLRAPIAGKTGNLSVHVGDLLRENGNALVTINQVRPIRVAFTVPQSDLAELRSRLRGGLRVDVSPAESDSAWIEGRLVFVDNQVDPASGTLLLKGEFPNRSAVLWPGEFVRVRLRLAEQADAIVVPTVAISQSQQGTYCYVLKADSTVEARPVRVARSWRELSVVAQGVGPGETVVTDGQLRLSPGAKAVVRDAASATSAPGASQ